MDFAPLELAQESFPTISEVALKLAVETKNRSFGRLGSLLYIIILKDVSTLSNRQATVFEAKIGAALEILERACMWPKDGGTKGHATLSMIAVAKRKGLARALKASSIDIHRGLKEFSSRSHEFEALLTVLDQTQTIKDLTPEDMGIDASPDSKKDNVPGYPQHVNETLYSTLDMHTFCTCPFQHLKAARLRLDHIEEYEEAKIPFEVLFPAAPAHDRDSPTREIWHETMLMVSRNRPHKKKPQKKTKVRVEGTELPLGEFCRHLKAKLGYCVRFYLVFENIDPVLRACDSSDHCVRNVKFTQSLSLTNVLYKIGSKMTTKERFHLAYILAKSVWQYYGSDWMRQPWTHNDIQFLEEQKSSGKSQVASYNPYYHPNFSSEGKGIGEFVSEGILLHRYPNILALAILLIEIIQGRPYDEQNNEPYGFVKIREYYKYAWNITVGTTLDCNIIYKEVIKKCLDGKIFKEAPFDEENPKAGIDMRRDIIYREIVFPLKHLLKLTSSSTGDAEPMLQAVEDNNTEQGAQMDERRRTATFSNNSSRRSSLEYPMVQSETIPPANPSIKMLLVEEDAINELARPRIALENRTQTLDSHISESRRSWTVERPETRDDFEIAIICAVKPEYDAVALLIDEFWDTEGDGYGRATEDQNTYRTGRIGKYNVVLALLPGMGKVNAGNVAAGFRSSFRGIEIALIVGICGGVPFHNGQEIILGDVIISGSLIQYDFGRRYTSGFKRKKTFRESLGRANTDVRGLLAALSTDDGTEFLEKRTLCHLKELQRRAQRRRKGKYDYPGADKDKLFESSYRHKHHASFKCDACNNCHEDTDDTCDRAMTGAACNELLCDESYLVRRTRLEEKLRSTEANSDIQQPYIHIGNVASGDTVMRSSHERDRIAKEDDVIGFEMEGAGVWDNLSCIIIKGVCDYCDSHKSKDWQNFASATAASAMKAVLERYGRRDRSPRPWDRRAYGR